MGDKLKVYFSGSIRGGRDDAEVYAEIIKALKVKYDVLTEHIGKKDVVAFEKNITDEGIYKKDVAFLKDCDLVIAECSTPSLGVGYELALAEALHKPVTVLFDLGKNKKLSAMISGDDYFKKIYYSDKEELMSIVSKL